MLKKTNEHSVVKNPEFNAQSQPLLKVEHLSMAFNKGKFTAVNDISFDIHQGEVFSLVGESGCGKTTTGRCLINLYKATSGNIWFKGELTNGQSFKKQSALKFNPKIQMIFQDPVSSLDPRMTVREIIAEGLIIQGEKNAATIEQKVNDVLLKVGLLPEYADRYPHEFSGGQKQRIGIARALIMNPDLIIADEPVSALDVSVKAQVINLLDDLRKQLGLTILFVAHDLSIVKYFSDRIAVMYKGRIVELADSQELFANPVHPYTKALLSAIPLPDPDAEAKRTRIVYNPQNDFNKELKFTQISSGHFVLQ